MTKVPGAAPPTRTTNPSTRWPQPYLYMTRWTSCQAPPRGCSGRGGLVLYLEEVPPNVVLSGEMAARPMRSSDLVIFEHEKGGCCVRVQTACPHHVAVVILSSDTHVHANVFPDALQDGGHGETPPGVALLRLVPYARKGIDAFVTAVERQPEVWDQVVSQLDERLKSRALQVRL